MASDTVSEFRHDSGAVAASRKRFPALPAPHSGVHVQVLPFDPDNPIRHQIVLVYTGNREALIDAGAAEPGMFSGAPTCGRGRDSHGFSYTRHGSKNGRKTIVRYILSTRVLDLLPGIPAGVVPDSIRWLNQNPGQLHIRKNERCEEITGSKEMLIAAEHLDAEFQSSDIGGQIRHSYLSNARVHRCVDGYLCVTGERSQYSLDQELEATAPANVRAAIQRHREAMQRAWDFHCGEIDKLREQERARRARRQPVLTIVSNGAEVAHG